jgi:predicted MFS family arabinose efflux permease
MHIHIIIRLIIIIIIVITSTLILFVNTDIIIIIIITIIIGGITWTQSSAPSGIWTSIASDSTGQHLAAVQYNYDLNKYGYIYTSSSG